jgi:hypothetical protein
MENGGITINGYFSSMILNGDTLRICYDRQSSTNCVQDQEGQTSFPGNLQAGEALTGEEIEMTNRKTP